MIYIIKDYRKVDPAKLTEMNAKMIFGYFQLHGYTGAVVDVQDSEELLFWKLSGIDLGSPSQFGIDSKTMVCHEMDSWCAENLTTVVKWWKSEYESVEYYDDWDYWDDEYWDDDFCEDYEGPEHWGIRDRVTKKDQVRKYLKGFD